MGCLPLFSKYFLAALNLIWLLGLIVIAILMGLFWKKIELTNYLKLIGYSYIPLLLIEITMIIMIFAVIFGFCFFCTNSKCLRLTYTNLLVLIFLLQIASVAIFFVYLPKTIEDINSRWGSLEGTVSAIEKSLNCCGFTDQSQDDVARCKRNNQSANTTYPCKSAIAQKILHNKAYYTVGLVFLILFQIALIVLAFIYACANEEDLGGEGEEIEDSDNDYFSD